MAAHEIRGIPPQCQILHVEQEVAGEDCTVMEKLQQHSFFHPIRSRAMEEQQFPPCSAIVAHPATMLTLIRICGWLWLEACDIALEHGVHQASVCRLRAGKGKGSITAQSSGRVSGRALRKGAFTCCKQMCMTN
eukprot:scaffold17621_cov20-Tisochrysis_lutea.AAC.4